jgi:hypothetical protein
MREGCANAFMQLAGTRAGDRRGGRVGAQRPGDPHQEWSGGRAALVVAAECPVRTVGVVLDLRPQDLRQMVTSYNQQPATSPGTRRGLCKSTVPRTHSLWGAWIGVTSTSHPRSGTHRRSSRRTSRPRSRSRKQSSITRADASLPGILSNRLAGGWSWPLAQRAAVCRGGRPIRLPRSGL